MSELQGMPITSLIFKLQDECESWETTARNAGKRVVQLEDENQRLREALGMAQVYVNRYGGQMQKQRVREALAGDGE